jgi:hypothetical protein
LRGLINSKIVKTRKQSELSKTEQNRLAKLNLMLDELRRGKNVQNRRLATWLTEEEYESFESDWECQQQIREELNDKPDELRRYENKLLQATFNDNKAEHFRKRVNKDKLQISYNNENIKAKLIAKDEFLDLALLKADAKNSNFINISTAPPKKLKRIIVAGYPFGLELSNDLKFNSGIITSLKGLGDDSTRIQIDAAINPANSGGPIVYEENGELAAVAVAGLSKDKREAVNFGIKASSVENFL